MEYSLGIDLGTTYSAAATARDDRLEIFQLGERSATIPSIVVLRADGEVLTGEAAERRALAEPTRTGREFKRRLGDPTPIILGGTPYGAEALLAHLLRGDRGRGQRAARRAAGRDRPVPPGELRRVQDRPAPAGRPPGGHRAGPLLTEPEAAAVDYARQERVPAGDGHRGLRLRRRHVRRDDPAQDRDGFEQLGRPGGHGAPRRHRLRRGDLHPRDGHSSGRPASRSTRTTRPRSPALARLREECRRAKEALSSDTDATIPIFLPGIQTGDAPDPRRVRGDDPAAHPRDDRGARASGPERRPRVRRDRPGPARRRQLADPARGGDGPRGDRHARSRSTRTPSTRWRSAPRTSPSRAGEAAAAGAGRAAVAAGRGRADGRRWRPRRRHHRGRAAEARPRRSAPGTRAAPPRARPSRRPPSRRPPPPAGARRPQPAAGGSGAWSAPASCRSPRCIGGRSCSSPSSRSGRPACCRRRGAQRHRRRGARLVGVRRRRPRRGAPPPVAERRHRRRRPPDPDPTPAPTPTPTPAAGTRGSTAITVSGGRYVVDYEVFGYTPDTARRDHVHFFFDTVPPTKAGMPGQGPAGYAVRRADPVQGLQGHRPAEGANQMCILVANPDHSVDPEDRQLRRPAAARRRRERWPTGRPTSPTDVRRIADDARRVADGHGPRSRPSDGRSGGSTSRSGSRSPAGSRPASRPSSTRSSASAWRRPMPASARGS